MHHRTGARAWSSASENTNYIEKKKAYEQKVREVEHASFTPLVLSASGGLGKEATVFYKRLASLLAEKWDQPYNQVINWLRCSLSYSLLRYNVCEAPDPPVVGPSGPSHQWIWCQRRHTFAPNTGLTKSFYFLCSLFILLVPYTQY